MTATPSSSPTDPHHTTIVIGGGPVGLAAALLLAQRGHQVTVYEAQDEFDPAPTNSYPIGVNTRGQEALRRIDPALLGRLRAEGEVVEAFHIYAGERRVSRLESGRLIATTRAFLTEILLDRVRATPAITYLAGHRLETLDLAAKTLTFTTSGGETLTVDAGAARVLAADGWRSAARTALTEQVPGFTPRIGDWGVQFRVAFSQPQASAPGLDPAVHHIFTAKGIYTATLKDAVWCVALTAIAGDPAEELLLSTQASEANVRALQAHVETYAPLAAPLLRHDDYVEFFSRKPFGGAVVVCPRLAFDEWLLLIGDAAHSVLPPTGEGVNSGLEDCFLLADAAATGSPTWFADFERDRLPDLHALGEYAWTLRDNIRSTDPARRTADLVLRIADSAAGALHLPSAQAEARLFGPDSGLQPYREALAPWIRQRHVLFPPIRRAVGAVQKITGRRPLPGDEQRGPAARIPAEQPLHLTVVGGSQGTGRALVAAARRAGHAVTVVSRSGASMPEGVRVVTGDAADPAVAREAVTGADAVVVTVGGSKGDARPRTRVTQAVVAAMQDAGVRRLIVQTSLGAGTSAEQLPVPLRFIAPRMLATALEDHNAQEDVVRGSGLDWTIVRPAGLTHQDATGRYRALRHDEPGTLRGRVARADVALCMLDALADPGTIEAQLGVSGA